MEESREDIRWYDQGSHSQSRGPYETCRGTIYKEKQNNKVSQLFIDRRPSIYFQTEPPKKTLRSSDQDSKMELPPFRQSARSYRPALFLETVSDLPLTLVLTMNMMEKDIANQRLVSKCRKTGMRPIDILSLRPGIDLSA